MRPVAAPHTPLRLQLPVAGVGLAYCAAAGHLRALAGEAADQLREGFFREFVDLSHVTSWNQVWWALRVALIGAVLCVLPKGKVPDKGSPH